MKRLVVVLAACGGDHATTDAAIDAGPAQLVAYYPMESDPDILGALDMAGNHHDGTCSIGDCPNLVAGHQGMGYHFDGTSQHLRLPDPPAFMLKHGFSISVWLAHDIARTDTIVVKPLAHDGESWQLDVTATGVAFCTSHQACVAADATIPLSTFVHLAMTSDGTTKHVYVAGTEVGSGTGASDYDVTLASVGADIENGTLRQPLQGALDELRIFDGALTPAEVATLATQ